MRGMGEEHTAVVPPGSGAGRNAFMIRNPHACRRAAEAERWDALRRMTAAESIAIGEALLTSDIMRFAVPFGDDRPRSLAIALGIASRVTAAAEEGYRGRQ